MTQETISFEEAFERLELILEKMTVNKMPLEDSLKYFEEAEGLIRACNSRLLSSEQRIEALIKQRGQVAVDSTQRPRTEPFARTPQPNFMIRDEPTSTTSP
jgi:exodeoxyribonuclease VII small subunit